MEKYNLNDIIKRVSEIENGEYKLLTKEYIGINQRVLLEHKCGYRYECKLKGFLNEGKSRCSKCKLKVKKSNKKITLEVFLQRVKEQVGDEYSYIKDFKNMRSKCLVRHNKCGHEWLVSPDMFLGVKQSRCPKCSNKNRGKYAIKENYLQSLLDDKFYGKDYKWLDEYKNNNKLRHKILHLKCNNVYLVRPNDFQQGYCCPFCKRSRGEERIEIYLRSHNFKYKKQFKFDDCRNINPLPFDFAIFCEDPNDYILIEFDGVQHFKNIWYTDNFEKQQLRDKIKDDYCNSHDNIDLYRINYKDYENIEKILDDIFSNYN
jgi:hypothetical protein